MTHKVEIIGHRGFANVYPENSLIGFKKAAELGVDGIELDVHVTKDREVVVIHDETIDRVTDGIGSVNNMTLTQLRKYRLKDVKGKQLTDEKIPTLEEVFEIIATHPDITLHIEVKTHNMLYENIEEKVLEIVEKCGSNRNIVYSSFHLPTLIRLKQLAANARVAFLFNRPIPHIHDYVATFQLDGVHPRKDVYMSYESLFRNSGNVRVWTPNSKRDLTRLLQANIAAVITKEPDRALAIRKDISQF